jgi:hypothetical protein
MVYEVGELFELGIQLSYLLILLGLLGTGTFFVIRQVLVRRELDLSAKDLQVSMLQINSTFVLLWPILYIPQKIPGYLWSRCTHDPLAILVYCWVLPIMDQTRGAAEGE